MPVRNSEGNLYKCLGMLLEYPTEESWDVWQTAVKAMAPISEKAAEYLELFHRKMKRMDLVQMQEFYVKSFDVMPGHSLYLSIYLFGEESFKRSELMTGLKTVYDRHDEFQMTELPDHLAVILKRQTSFAEEEWTEFVRMGLLPALPRMISSLEKNANPYANILKAIEEFLLIMEKAHV